MDLHIVSRATISEQAHASAVAGECIDAANPYPLATDAGQVWRVAYLQARLAHLCARRNAGDAA